MTYLIPTASTTDLGLVQIGANILVTEDGIISTAPPGLGPTGSQGAQGTTGTQGSTGAQGFQGTQGSTGAGGNQGFTGAPGSTGTTGAQGRTGSTGAQGSTGSGGVGSGTYGSWSPTLSGLTSGTYTVTLSGCDYYLWGRICLCNFSITVNSSGPVGQIVLGNLPFSSSTNPVSSGGLLINFLSNLPSSNAQLITGQVVTNSKNVVLWAGGFKSYVAFDNTNLQTGSQISGTITYITA